MGDELFLVCRLFSFTYHLHHKYRHVTVVKTVSINLSNEKSKILIKLRISTWGNFASQFMTCNSTFRHALVFFFAFLHIFRKQPMRKDSCLSYSLIEFYKLTYRSTIFTTFTLKHYSVWMFTFQGPCFAQQTTVVIVARWRILKFYLSPEKRLI